MKFGFTAYEAQALGPHIVLKEERSDTVSLALWVLMFVVLGITLINTFLLPMTVAHADTKVLTDREQETQYCKAWMRGVQVTGGTESAIATHCNKYL